MRHGVLGPGGVGGLIAAVLADAGSAVTLIVRPGTELSYPREIILESRFKNVRAPVAVASAPTAPLDLLWVTVKSTQLRSAVETLPKSFRADTVIPLLNGIDHMDYLRAKFGLESVVPATIAVESERAAPGTIVQRSPFVRFGTLKTAKERLGATLQIFESFGFECAFAENEPTLLWSKLVFLAPLALSTSVARSPIGRVLSDPVRAEQLEACVREACEVARRAGATVDANAVLARIKSLPSGMRSSMEKDVANGNPLELDAIAGPILRSAKTYGISMKATPAMVSELTHVEA